jgi:hypothetical protein
MFMTDRSALMTPQNALPGQQAYTFLICILSTSFISVSIFSVCCYSRVSISMVQTWLRGRFCNPGGGGGAKII